MYGTAVQWVHVLQLYGTAVLQCIAYEYRLYAVPATLLDNTSLRVMYEYNINMFMGVYILITCTAVQLYTPSHSLSLAHFSSLLLFE
jgi:hypothetical protein